MKKLLLGLIVLSVVFITACTSGTQEGTFSMKTNEDIISMQVLTTASLLPKTDSESLSIDTQDSILKLTEVTTGQPNSIKTDELVQQIEPYIELVEQFLGSNNGLNVVVESSEMAEYELKMSFETSSLLGESRQYVIHYNMILEDEDEDDDESEFSLTGIMIIGEDIYQLTGEREVEIGEEEVEFTARLDDDNYVESSYSVEDDEIEFDIKIVRNGDIISETSLEIEFEEDETKIELEFLDGENTGNYEFKYEMENDVPVLKIQFDATINGIQESGEITLSVHKDNTTGKTYYQVYRESADDDYVDRYDRDIDEDDDDDDDE